jgi:hypothetical protein
LGTELIGGLLARLCVHRLLQLPIYGSSREHGRGIGGGRSGSVDGGREGALRRPPNGRAAAGESAARRSIAGCSFLLHDLAAGRSRAADGARPPLSRGPAGAQRAHPQEEAATDMLRAPSEEPVPPQGQGVPSPQHGGHTAGEVQQPQAWAAAREIVPAERRTGSQKQRRRGGRREATCSGGRCRV